VAQELGIRKGQAHRALADVELTWEVFKKLKAILETKGVIDFTNFAQLFSIQEDFLKNITGQKLAQIQEAIDLGVRLKIRYLSSGAEVTEREVIPKEIRQENGRGYLVGYCCLRKEERTFRIDGLLHIEII
jgi:predicted DNA-binding transcriptional regulator YafY